MRLTSENLPDPGSDTVNNEERFWVPFSRATLRGRSHLTLVSSALLSVTGSERRIVFL